MLYIDMTSQLSPLLYGMDAVLCVTGAALVAIAVAPRVRAWLQRERGQLLVARPIYAGQGSR